ncbi:ABC transporter ATP-binding protein [Ureibacillus sinduriensis]|uniref:Peptide ABC transporter ATPase n=1 Tax=Ureibacillus sinduriensis BLB-1 = JCM 15800 TaxID=1384057 RepID=A0A0A3HWR4_9BACL|nr:ABC transporter ATP-binding protein [Ureibacillus sinduriensis]KGR74773.1 peptide ABC transporter ATPase [Ureibacillus sinduriensis BLB-1 = JCM 15800]
MVQDSNTLLQVEQMKTVFKTRTGNLEAVDGVSFSISKGETVAIVGESGSGKSVSALSILRLLDGNGEVISGKILFNDLNLKDLSNEKIRKIRGKEIAMIFQDPMTCLDPVYTIGDQIIETIKIHEDLSKGELRNRALELLKLVGLPDPESRIDAYPHQLSGGQRQRVMIAIALACRPNLIIADEPTTALDVTVQAQIMQLLKDLQSQFGTAIILVTHDLGVVAEMADKVVVVYAGQVVEQAHVKELFHKPQHPYTEALMKSIPKIDTDKNRRLQTIKGNVPSLKETPSGCRFHPRCPLATEKCKSEEPPLFEVASNRVSKCWIADPNIQSKREIPALIEEQEFNFEINEHLLNKQLLLDVSNLQKYFPITKGILSRTIGHVKAVDDVSLTINKGEILGLVGESGCGKSTVGRLITGLIDSTDGEVNFDGKQLSSANRKDKKGIRKRIQFVFQDPYSSLNPRMTILDIIGEPLEVHNLAKGPMKRQRVAELLELVGLSKNDMHKFPHQFSGGQRQRIGIARALATEPDLLICDEAVSALDVSVQAQILNLLKDLQLKLGLSYLFISHDLNVVKYISDRIAVMYLGEIVEVTDSQTLFKEPLHPYAKALISAVPIPNPDIKNERIILSGEVPSPSNPPSGCKFHTRCPAAMDVCKQQKPELRVIKEGHTVSCHLYRKENRA